MTFCATAALTLASAISWGRRSHCEPRIWKAEDIVRIRSHALSRNVVSQAERARIACIAGVATDRLRRKLEPQWITQVPAGRHRRHATSFLAKILCTQSKMVGYGRGFLNIVGAAAVDRRPSVTIE